MNDISETLSAQAGLLCELLTSAMTPKLEEAGISLGTFELLSAIQASGGKATQIELAQRLGITAPSLSETVKSVCKRGLAEQHADSNDGRRKILKLTPTGRKAVQSIVKDVNNAEAKMVEGIEAKHIASAIEVLRRANRNLAKAVQANRSGPA